MISIKGTSLSKIDRSSAHYKALQAFHERLKHKDSTIWGPDAQAEASIRLNWIDLPESSRELLPNLMLWLRSIVTRVQLFCVGWVDLHLGQR